MNLQENPMSDGKNQKNENRISWLTCVFVSKEEEARFRQSMLKHDINISVYILMILCVISPVCLTADPLIVKPEFWPTWIVSLRLLFSAFCLLTIGILRKRRKFVSFQITITIFSVIFWIYLLIMITTFQDTYALYALFDMLIIVAFFFSGLLPVITTAIICAIYMIAVILIGVYFKTFDQHTLFVLILAYSACYAVGMSLSTQKHLYIRRDYDAKIQLRDQARALHKMAYRDPLTSAYNRRSFQDNFPQYLRCAQRSMLNEHPVYIIMADIDYFKRINDTFGHDTGDQVLIAFTNLLSSSIKPTDGLYRFGGEEFVIVLVYCPENAAKARIEEIMNKLNQRALGIKEINYPVTSSFGMTRLLPEDDWEKAISRVDTGLYQAKENGRNQLVFVDGGP